MQSFRSRLLATAGVPLALAVGVGISAGAASGIIASKPASAACAACPNPCNPCCTKNPCNPCGAASPCAAANPCNPCAAKNPCNPCAAANPCNPCAAANPCSPCGAAVRVSSRCVVPRIVKAAIANPCAAKNPCNPCAAANPCNPCAAANPCNPCGAGAAVELTNTEAARAYDCLIGQMRSAYAKSGNPVAASYQGWQRYSKVAYQSATHGSRYVQNYANAKGRAYGAFEKAGRMPVGATLAKDSFAVNGKGQATPGPLFIMQKMPAGFNSDGGDWKYTMIMPNGSVFGETRGRNAAGMQFCIECHIAVGDDQDSMMLLPEEYRVR